MSDKLTTVKTQRSYQAIVLGAGLGGLSAALELSLKGKKILLLEQHNIPGGFATSFIRGRFEFDVALHQLSDVGADSKNGALKKFLETEAGIKIDFLRPPEAYHIVCPEEGIDLRIPFGVDAFVRAIESVVPGSQASLSRYLDLCKEVAQAFYLTLGTKGRAREYVFEKFPRLMETARKTVDVVTDELMVPPRAKRILYAYWYYLGIPMDRMNFTVWAVMLLGYLETGGHVPRQNSNALSCSIAQRVRELGSEIEYNTKVDSIEVSEGRIVGVRTDHGEFIRTDFLVSNASPHLVFSRLIQPRAAISESLLAATFKRRLGSSAVVVYLGLSASAESLGIAAYEYFFSPRMDTSAEYRDSQRLGLPDAFTAVCLNLADPHCSPPGTCVVNLTTLVGPNILDGLDSLQYGRTKTAYAQRMISIFEKYLGRNLRSYIEEIEIATPQTFHRYTGAHQGVIYGYEQDIEDSIFVRSLGPVLSESILGLDFVGGHGELGHGFTPSIISGRTTALRILKKMQEPPASHDGSILE